MMNELTRFSKLVLKKAYYLGWGYYCPECKSHVRGFLFSGYDLPVLRERQIIGSGRRKDTCPVCRSSDRTRMVFLYLRNYLKISDPGKKWKILHVAPELDLYYSLKSIANYSEYICGDKFEEGYSYPDFVSYMDLTTIPHESNSFDLIICNHVLEHIPEDGKAMSELFRVLKPGGMAILQVPISKNLEYTLEDWSISTPVDRERVFGQRNHCRIYGKDYESRLEKAGFVFSSININAQENSKKYGLNKEESLLIVHKPMSSRIP